MYSVRTRGWLVSFAVHGGALALAMHAVVDITPHLQPEKFQWDVVLHEAPAPNPVVSETMPPQKSSSKPAPPQPSHRPMQPAAEPPVRRTIERTPVMQTVQTVQSVQSAPQVVERSSIQERQTVATEVQAVEAQAVREEVSARAEEVVQQNIHETAQSSDQSIAAASVVAVRQQDASVGEAQTAAIQQSTVVQQAVVQATERMATTVAATSERNNPIESEPAMVHRGTVAHRLVREVAQAQADFGWLSESLWKRIEQLKRYPMQARARRWEGKVVLEAVIRQDGTILECLVAESSGHGILDQDAVSVLRRASPLALKHPLGKERITILVPIAYRLES
ncbi:MAG: TonB family protein [Nitrospira sp.]